MNNSVALKKDLIATQKQLSKLQIEAWELLRNSQIEIESFLQCQTVTDNLGRVAQG